MTTAALDTARALAPIFRKHLAGRASVRRRGEVITITDEAVPPILREPDADELLAPLLGPRVGLRARAHMVHEPRWTLGNLAVEAHRGAREVRNLGCMLRTLRAAEQRQRFARRDYARLVERT